MTMLNLKNSILLSSVGFLVLSLSACTELANDPVTELRKSIEEKLQLDCFLQAQKHDFLTDVYRQGSNLEFLVGKENKRAAPPLPTEITLKEFIELKPLLERDRTVIPTPFADNKITSHSQQSGSEIWEYNFKNEKFFFSCKTEIGFDEDIPIPTNTFDLNITRTEI